MEKDKLKVITLMPLSKNREKTKKTKRKRLEKWLFIDDYHQILVREVNIARQLNIEIFFTAKVKAIVKLKDEEQKIRQYVV